MSGRRSRKLLFVAVHFKVGRVATNYPYNGVSSIHEPFKISFLQVGDKW